MFNIKRAVFHIYLGREQFRQNRYPLTNKYMTAHFPGLEQTLQ
jgi:hypothetical protein